MGVNTLNNLVITEQVLGLLICPVCHGKLRFESSSAKCTHCGKAYMLKDGIPLLLSGLSKREEEQLSFSEYMYLSKTISTQYNEYVKRIFFQVTNENYFLPLLLAKIKPDDIVLDVGCGGGNVARQIASTDAVIINMDISLKAVEYAICAINSPKSSFIQGSFLNIPLLNASVDIVVAYFVLHHIEDTKRAISEIRRVLKPGGYFICLEPIGRITWFELWLDFLKIPFWLQRPLKEIYARLQRRFAFEGGTHGIEAPKKNEFQKHFFKNIDEYGQVLNGYNFADVRLKSIFLEFLPPRFFELKHYNLVAMLFKISDVLIKNFKSLSRKGKFIIIEARNP